MNQQTIKNRSVNRRLQAESTCDIRSAVIRENRVLVPKSKKHQDECPDKYDYIFFAAAHQLKIIFKTRIFTPAKANKNLQQTFVLWKYALAGICILYI